MLIVIFLIGIVFGVLIGVMLGYLFFDTLTCLFGEKRRNNAKVYDLVGYNYPIKFLKKLK